MSIFLGEQLTKIIAMIESGKMEKAKKQDLIDLGVNLLPQFFRDTTDRNRTSPFAFTGQKFEFRALGSSVNISTSIAVVNTVVADSLLIMADRIKAEMKNGDLTSAVMKVLAGAIKESKAILFEGNNYSEEWVKEAAKRGLPNVASSPEALKAFITPKAIDLFERHNVFSKVELTARYHIWLDIYEKVIEIEARTLAEMVNTQVLPNAYEFQTDIGSNLELLRDLSDDSSVGILDGALGDRKEFFSRITSDIYYIRKNLKEMEALLVKSHSMELEQKTAFFFAELKPHLDHIRRHVDALEAVMPDQLWHLPKYREMLFIS